jgi:ferredoxin
MARLESDIKDFMHAQGVELVGLAGPERFDGPPSVDLDYSMPGANSLISMAMPMHVGAVYDFLAKRSPAPHNLDQFLKYQRILRIERELADYLVARGYRARPLPMSADYRRAPYVFSLKPAFSLRLGAIASGIAAPGWSGNVKTREYGAAVHLGGVVTDASLASDPLIPTNYFIDDYCSKCKRCAKSCPSRMFEAKEKEYIYLNGELLPRGRKRNIDLCNVACFGLHGLSRDHKWSNWGLHWIDSWVEREPDPGKRLSILAALLKRGLTTGDSTQRFDVLRRLCYILWPEETLDGIPEVDELPEDEGERYRILAEFMRRMGIRGIESYPVPMICGQCALVCGPTLEETAERYRILASSGIVVPDSDGRMVRVETFEEAQALRRLRPDRAGKLKEARDILATALLWHRHYFGIEPKTIYRNRLYRRKLNKAVEKARGEN